ncbi:hypothetical protein SADUNF_Sadunf14G0101900 [Salix dunnii]|uniref:Uncharacterized protein n=1 Tax=Salix dunnii TaxID=1413687 RepID=A0A835MQ69_9ROSI|nr:hypothetical protein SADUNF_Sadunf14G0101900 [Salix dunnii]
MKSGGGVGARRLPCTITPSNGWLFSNQMLIMALKIPARTGMEFSLLWVGEPPQSQAFWLTYARKDCSPQFKLCKLPDSPILSHSYWYYKLLDKEMDRVKNSVDVSPFLLVEAAGDSEVDSDPATSTTVVADDDDAESCSCDTSDHSCVINGEVEAGRVNCNVSDDDHADNEDEEEEVEEGVEVCQSWFGHVHVGLPVKQKPCVSVDSGNESMNEKEKDRLFWEACLAS